MGVITIILLAFGLCFDSFAVSLSSGMAGCGIKRRYYIRFAVVLALFQGAMPLIGWVLATNLHTYIAQIDHWIAFILLALLGSKMIYEALNSEKGEASCSSFGLKQSALLGFATSIDALISGAALAMIRVEILPQASQMCNILIAVAIITLVTFVAAATGLFVGKRASSHLGERAELIGGAILILIGTKVLIEHLIS